MASQSVDRDRKVDVGINKEFIITNELQCIRTGVLQTRTYKFTYKAFYLLATGTLAYTYVCMGVLH